MTFTFEQCMFMILWCAISLVVGFVLGCKSKE